MITVMAHSSRKVQAQELNLKLKKQGFESDITWDEINNEWETGSRALAKGIGKTGFWLVIQDDGIITDNFYKCVELAIEKAPTRSLISFYTGTTKPHGKLVTQAVEMAQEYKINYLRASTLLWGVCIAIPTEHIEGVLKQKSNKLYDRRIGQYFKDCKLPVYYTNPSLVDHRDEGSLIKHDVKKPRVAHNFGDNLGWDSRFLDMGI